ncbi:hypothetical protein I316_05458 [Kwoniella heveanensis BCC8398]|uniref:Copper acquisition factor BIM1-like domain-containing protein n=1 Tax=Kwoniella heveanensis BCC8398 TaxID=1296120 RepID=A0A1B9GP39_9TREE|nr:hypothetical protein I316_05458 [Kwoniella heveanensis BCC8398]
MLFQAITVSAVAVVASAISIDRRAAITDFTSSPVGFSWPPARGFSADTATKAPCGGFAAGTRADYPVNGGEIALTSRAQVDNVNILWTNESDPTRFHSFSTYAHSLLDLGAGHYCQSAPDFASLGFNEGDDATLMIMYQLENSTTDYYYECADIKLVAADGFRASQQYVCGNYTSTLNEASEDESMKVGSTKSSSTTSAPVSVASETSSASESESSSSSDSGISAAAGGGIGAAVAIVVIAVLAAGAYVAGYVRFGKKQPVVLADHASDSTGVPMKMAQA